MICAAISLSSCVRGQALPMNDTNTSDLPVLKRSRRYLDFTKGARISWRCNVKNNILKVNTLWAYGYGFRANFPFPDKADRLRPFYKRDVFQGLSDVLDGHGLDGSACLLKSFCTAHLASDRDVGKGMLFKLLKLLFTASLSVAGQASGSSDTDKEIAFISVNGSHLDVSKTALRSSTLKAESDSSAVSQTLKRGKRYLDFLETSRMIFRVNVKNNIIPKPTIWAHGYGFRCNYPIENDRKVRPFRRDTYEVLGDLMQNIGFDGQACILKAYCAAHLDDDTQPNGGILFKLLKYIFTLNSEDKRHFPYLHHGNCQQILHSHCPLSFNNISPFTDDV
ncbi:uncharacterized protein LOC106088879 [Stomoxys calcitrans]|uniref:uncharacterized protein LOC106088879 n=1 Tax=Stomoxys calcitrans TaxID=35570 RepID=UPI0027E2FCD9|nr:uncharacterized protein LOC106088879 [Stomoxys calcitrans]